MEVSYKVNKPISVEQFIDLLVDSTLGERRPVENIECIKGMLANANLLVSAWSQDNLVGIARSVTDFHYACYLSDLAVQKEWQSIGIGKELQIRTQKELGPECKLILIAAPAADGYYRQLGFERNERCWVLNRDDEISC